MLSGDQILDRRLPERGTFKRSGVVKSQNLGHMAVFSDSLLCIVNLWRVALLFKIFFGYNRKLVMITPVTK